MTEHSSAGATVSNVRISFESPAIPPFWFVSMDAEIREPQMPTGHGYISARLLLIEPFTGIVIPMGQG